MATRDAALNRLTKWRAVFAGWQLGTRGKDDPEAQAVRDHREVTMLMRAELNAMLGLLTEKGVFGLEEWIARLNDEAVWLEEQYQRRFPGARATDHGIEIFDPKLYVETTKGWLP